MRVKEIILTTLLLLVAGSAFADYSGTITREIDLNIKEDAKTAKLWVTYPAAESSLSAWSFSAPLRETIPLSYSLGN